MQLTWIGTWSTPGTLAQLQWNVNIKTHIMPKKSLQRPLQPSWATSHRQVPSITQTLFSFTIMTRMKSFTNFYLMQVIELQKHHVRYQELLFPSKLMAKANQISSITIPFTHFTKACLERQVSKDAIFVSNQKVPFFAPTWCFSKTAACF